MPSVSYDDLQQDQRPILCRNSERNLIVAFPSVHDSQITLEALMNVFVDASYSAYHQMVIEALSLVVSQMSNT